MQDSNTMVKVWDPFVRFFHWSVVVAFATAYLTEGDWMLPHAWAGYYIAILIGLRLIWGLVGSRHARFSDFIKSPSTTKAYLKDISRGRAKRYLGHNPAGAAMVVALLLSLMGTVFFGMALYGVGGEGPFAGTLFSAMPESIVESLHEFLANVTVFLIVLHVGGVLLASISHGENLVKAMWHGKKKPDQ